MQVNKKRISDTKVQLSVGADAAFLTRTKQTVLGRLGRELKLPGFRPGKVPPALVEKSVDASVLQSEFLDAAVNELYSAAIIQVKLRPVERPEVSIKKFVPFTTLEFEATVEAVGDVKLPDYTKVKLAKKPISVTVKEVNEVIEALRARAAERKEVARAAKTGDEVVVDFSGTDAETGEPIQGADGKGYPLVLGSNAFIPGFEDNLVGINAGEEKAFTLTFPKDYGVKALQNRKITFNITATKVHEVLKSKIDDDFAAKAGPVKTVAELKADIKKQLTTEQQTRAERDFESELLEKITEQSIVPVPKVLVDEEIDRNELDEKQNLTYRGQTWQEHLAAEGVTEAEHREQKRAAALEHVKAGLVLTEIAEKEGLSVTMEELEIRIQVLKGQYQDSQMRAELNKPESRREIASRLLTEKTLERLKSYADAK
jgi:trigger factor